MESRFGRHRTHLSAAVRLVFLLGLPALAQGQDQCATEHHRAFDFWIGAWDVFEFKNPVQPVAHARVDEILEGCALREHYEGANGLVGESFSIWDAARGVWHQSWVTNRGQLLQLDGGMEKGHMVLTGPWFAPDGRPGLIRGDWYRVSEGIRETARTSTDGGKTWQPLFDLLFRSARP